MCVGSHKDVTKCVRAQGLVWSSETPFLDSEEEEEEEVVVERNQEKDEVRSSRCCTSTLAV